MSKILPLKVKKTCFTALTQIYKYTTSGLATVTKYTEDDRQLLYYTDMTDEEGTHNVKNQQYLKKPNNIQFEHRCRMV